LFVCLFLLSIHSRMSAYWLYHFSSCRHSCIINIGLMFAIQSDRWCIKNMCHSINFGNFIPFSQSNQFLLRDSPLLWLLRMARSLRQVMKNRKAKKCATAI
jgi:hypothetical protein